MNNEAFLDTSPFQGIKEFATDDGEELRVEYRGLSKEATFYRKRGGSFVRVGAVTCAAPVKRMTCKQLHGAYLNAELDEPVDLDA